MTSKTIEEYLEVIYELIEEKGYARTVDISSRLNVQPPSVTEMIQRMDEGGYLIYEKYRGLKLTRKGSDLAKEVCGKHKILATFLKILGVDEEIAEVDACKIEHNIDSETMARLTKFVEFVECSNHDRSWIERFNHYAITGEFLCASDDSK